MSSAKDLSNKLFYKCIKYIERKKEEYVFCTVEEVLKSQREKEVRVIGMYKYKSGHYLADFDYRRTKVETVTANEVDLDVSDVAKYPPIGSFIELFGKVNVGGKVTIYVHFYDELGFDISETSDYVEALRCMQNAVRLNPNS